MNVKDLRGRLRDCVQCDPLLMELFGFRISRKTRARSDDELREPTIRERARALHLLKADVPAHEVEAYWKTRGVKITRNELSQMMGARG